MLSQNFMRIFLFLSISFYSLLNYTVIIEDDHTGLTFMVDVDENTTIRELRSKVFKAYKRKRVSQIILYTLYIKFENDNTKLKDYGYKNCDLASGHLIFYSKAIYY